MIAGALQLVALATVRWLAVLRVQPLLRIGLGPVAWAVAFVFAIVLALREAGPTASPVPTDAFVLALVAEALLGTVVGHALALGAHAVVGAAASTATVLRAPPSAMVGLFAALVLAAALASGLHHVALRGAIALHEAWPLGDPQAWIPRAADAVPMLVVAASGAFVLALAFATPALLTAATAEIVAAAVARGPGAALALGRAVAPTLRLAMVLVALGASWAIDLPRWAAAALPG